MRAAFEAPGSVPGLDDLAVKRETTQQGRGHLGVTGEDTRPFAEGEIGGDDDRGSLVEPADEMEQQLDAGTHPEDGSFLRIERFQGETIQYLTYHLGTKAYDRGVAAGVEFDEAEWPLLLAEYDLENRMLTTYPTWLRSNIPIFSKPKYSRIKRISFEDQDPIEVQKGFDMILDLPTGFLKSPLECFGVVPRAVMTR